jgi:hypothetical protein
VTAAAARRATRPHVALIKGYDYPRVDFHLRNQYSITLILVKTIINEGDARSKLDQ